MTIPKRSPEEWATAARIARDVRTVFCEGPSDAGLIKVAAGFPEHCDFRSADEVEYDPIPHPFDGSNKLRIKALAQVVFDQAIPNLKCLVDTDFGIFLGNEIVGDILVYTNASNIISDSISFEWTRNLLQSGYNQDLTVEQWDQAVSDLSFAFACRFLVAQDQTGVAAPNYADHMVKNGSWVTFSRAPYVQAYTTLQGVQQDVFVQRIAALNVHGHDASTLVNSNDLFGFLFGVLRRLGKIKQTVPLEAVRSATLAALPPVLGARPNVLQLIQWVSQRP